MKSTTFIAIGISLLVLGITSLIIGLASRSNIETKFSVVGLIGPFPIGFGNDKTLFLLSLAILAFILVFYLLQKRIC